MMILVAMKTHIRPAELSDIDELLAIEQACFEPWRRSSRRSLTHSLNSPFQQIWLAEHRAPDSDGAVVGMLVLHHHVHTLRIYSLAVLRRHRREGIGTRLLKHAHSLAEERQYAHLSLEVDAANTRLIHWYESHGYSTVASLPDYYAPGEHGVRMRQDLPTGRPPRSQVIVNLIVSDTPAELDIDVDGVELISADDYLTQPRFQDISSARVFNLCSTYRYQSAGYYVSLLAEARGHRSIPSVSTIQDFQSRSIIRSMTDEMDDLVQRVLSPHTDKEFALDIYFSRSLEKPYSELASKLYRMFPTPLLRVGFMRVKTKWLINRIRPLSVHKIDPALRPAIRKLAQSFFTRKRFHQARIRNYAYDIAVLYDPKENEPPSSPATLKRFCRIAEQMNIYMELITRNDADRLGEFDALFIRQTTSVNHYTYQLSRKAYAEGLIVIDDPWSILRCANKVYLAERLAQERISTPKSWILDRNWLINGQLEALPLPLIVKEPDGAFSRGVTKVSELAELRQTVQSLLKKSDLLLAQEFMPSPFDWRVGILDRKPLFACQYHMAAGHWQIVNWETTRKKDLWGAHRTFAIEEVPPTVLKMAIRAANLIGDGLYGVDIKEINGKAYVIEINDNPNIDLGVEDQVLKNELYRRIVQSFITRINVARDISRLRL